MNSNEDWIGSTRKYIRFEEEQTLYCEPLHKIINLTSISPESIISLHKLSGQDFGSHLARFVT